MNDPQQTVSWRRDGIRDRLPLYDDSADFEDLPSATDSSAGLISLGYIGSTLRRGMRVWLVLTVIGLIVGAGLAVKHAPAHSATTTVLMDTAAQGADQGTELATDAAIAQSTPVAAAVVAQLGLRQTPTNFLSTYTVILGDTAVLTITAQGPDDNAAVQRASAIAGQFLAYRAKYLQQQLQETADSLTAQVSQAQRSLAAINTQISQVSAQPSSPSQQANLDHLKQQQTDAQNALSQVKQSADYTLLTAHTQTAQKVQGSQVLSAPAPNKRSVKKILVLYTVGGLLGGLIIGMVIVVIGGITSGKLRRRDDIAIAAGAPVKLSVGRLRRHRWLPDLRERSGRGDRDLDRVVEHLRNAVPASARGVAGLAVVAADDAPTVARAVVKLAIASSQQRRRVVIADLSDGAAAAHSLGVTSSGISTVSPEGVAIVVVVPEPSDIAPVGPLRTSLPGLAQVSERLAETCAHANLLLSVVTLNPSFGGDFLATWATDAVAVVTAGRSTATQVHATCEMIRLAGTRLDSVVVFDADKGDESLGTVSADYEPSPSVRP